MGQGNKKVWLCLLAVVLTAVVVGAVYYYNSAERKNSSEGVLIRETEVEGRKRTYALTDKGREAFQEELARLRACVNDGEEELS